MGWGVGDVGAVFAADYGDGVVFELMFEEALG